MYRNYMTNFGWFTDSNYTTFADALAAARKGGFETSIYKDGELVAGWGGFSGVQFYSDAVRAEFYAK